MGIITCSSLKFIKLKLRYPNWLVTELANVLSGIWPQVVEPRTYTFHHYIFLTSSLSTETMNMYDAGPIIIF